MKHVLGAILLSVTSIFAQGSYGVLDQYYGEVLYEGNELILLVNNINYPGLKLESSLSRGAGFYNSQSIYTVGSFSWDKLYFWNEIKNEIGTVGFWLGQVNLETSEKTESNNTEYIDPKSQTIKGKLAFWLKPKNNSRLNGISIIIEDAGNSYRENHQVNGSISRSSQVSDLDNKYISISSIAIFRLTPLLHARIATKGSYGDSIENNRRLDYFLEDTTNLWYVSYLNYNNSENKYRSFF